MVMQRYQVIKKLTNSYLGMLASFIWTLCTIVSVLFPLMPDSFYLLQLPPFSSLNVLASLPISAVTHSFFACSVLGLVGIIAWLEVIITVLVKYVIAWISTWGSYGARARDTAVTTVDTGISRSKAEGIISGIAFAFPTPWSMTIISNLILCYWSDLPFFSLSFLDRDINNCLFVCFERKQLVELARSSWAVIFLCVKKYLQF